MTKNPQDMTAAEILRSAAGRALDGGLSGAAAMGIQVTTLMWMRTTMNYQYRYGLSTKEALSTLYKEGGVRRFYRGYLPALIQGPISRFGDTASNVGMLHLLDSSELTKDMNIASKTLCASFAAASFRIFLMPVDTFKTVLQVEGKNGLSVLRSKYQARGLPVFWYGALAASSATLVGHFPWFFTYNTLNKNLPQAESLVQKLCRSAFIGFTASVISDTCSNSIRVVKTYKQANQVPITYVQVVKNIVQSDGIIGLFGRGLKTRILTNGMQGLIFSVLWRLIDDKLKARH